jgi:hypothetical protein
LSNEALHTGLRSWPRWLSNGLTSVRYAEREILHRLAVLAAVLRLGTKYGVAYLREIAVARLMQLFPHTYTAYLKIAELAHRGHWPYKESTRRQGALISIILARECNVPAVLPCCLFIWTPSFGDNISRFSPESTEAHCTLEDGRRYAPDLDTYSLCLRVGWQLSDFRQRLILVALSSAVCTGESCRSEGTRTAMDDQMVRRDNDDPDEYLHLLEDLGYGRWMFVFQICAPCAEEAASVWKQGCCRTWEKLPGYYGLGPSWEELVAATQPVAEHDPLL